MSYLKSTHMQGIFSPNRQQTLKRHADADYAGGKDTRKLSVAWCTLLISRQYTRHPSTKTQFLSQLVKPNILRPQQWLSRRSGCAIYLMYSSTNKIATKLVIDKKSVEKFALSSAQTPHSRYLYTRHHCLKYIVCSQVVQNQYLPTLQIFADILCESTTSEHLKTISKQLNLASSTHSWRLGCYYMRSSNKSSVTKALMSLV